MGSGRSAASQALLAAAFEDGTDLLSQAVAVLRARPNAAELDFYGIDDPAALPVGAADRRLLSEFGALTGGPLDVTATCGACGERTTLTLTEESVGQHAWASLRIAEGAGLREPTYEDLQSCGADSVALVRRCEIGSAAGTSTWEQLDSIEQSLAGPLRSTCAECGAPISVDADVVTLILEGLARVCLDFDREVHLIASTYGWDLATIESLSDARRQRLAAMVSGVA